MENPVTELVVKFADGDYTIRPDGIGDTILGKTAHDIMFKMNRKHGYTAKLSMYQKIHFILNYAPEIKK